MSSERRDLTCPISLEVFVDPISTPCCGNAFSRQPLKLYMKSEGGECCPLCRHYFKSFPEFDIDKVPTNRTISSLVDSLKNVSLGEINDPSMFESNSSTSSSKQSSNQGPQGPQWKCLKTPIFSKNGHTKLPIDHLEVEVEWPSYEGEVCMFLPVIDQSGSMSGKPFLQVKEALMHMLHQTMAHRSVFTCIIPYSSRATSIRVPRDGDAGTERWAGVQNKIQTMKAGGGTSFLNAFEEIKNVIFGDTRGGKVRAQAFAPGTAEYEEQRRLGRQGLLVQGAPAFVTSIAIVFMTDGQDNSSSYRQSGNSSGRMDLVDKLKFMLKDWKKEVVVHTVGFSRDHDFDFLDSLRKVGTKEGMFRYADPSDGDDALCSKLSELTDSVIAQGGSFPVHLTLPPAWKPFLNSTEPQEASDKESSSSSSQRGSGGNREIMKMLMMESGRGSLSLFMKATDNIKDDETISLRIPANQCPINTFQVPVHSQSLKEEEQSQAEKNDRSLFEWESHLCSEVAQEALQLGQIYKDIIQPFSKSTGPSALSRSAEDSQKSSQTVSPTTFNLHAALLLQRARCLETHVSLNKSQSDNKTRLELCSAQITNMLQGKDANAARLNDAKFSSNKTMSKSSNHVTPPPPPPPIKPTLTNHAFLGGALYSSKRTTTNQFGQQSVKYGGFKSVKGEGMLSGRKKNCSLHRMVLSGSIDRLKDICLTQTEELLMVDEFGDTPLSYAATIGKMKAVETLLSCEGCQAVLTLKNKAGFTPLEMAARRGHWKSLNMIYSVGGADYITDASETIQTALNSGYFQTAATIACLGIGGSNPDMLKGRVPSEMLEKAILSSVENQFNRETLSASTSTSTKLGNGYLKRACQNGMYELVMKCLNSFGSLDDCLTSYDEVLEMLSYCGEHGDTGAKIADALLTSYFQSSSSSSSSSETRHTASSPKDPSEETPDSAGALIYEAAEKGYVQFLEVLLRYFPDEVNYCNANKSTPLIAACTTRKMECILLLLKSNADVSSLDDNDRSPLIASIDRNHCAAVALFLTSGAPLTYISSSSSSSSSLSTKSSNNHLIPLNVLFICCATSRPEILDIILKHCKKAFGSSEGAGSKFDMFLNEVNEEGLTPLMMATKYNDVECIKVLLSHHCDVYKTTCKQDYPSMNHGNALHLSCLLKHHSSCFALLEYGATCHHQNDSQNQSNQFINSQDGEGRTALHIAVLKNDLSLVKILRNFGIDIFIKDNQNKTASAYISNSQNSSQNNSENDAKNISLELLDPALILLFQASRCMKLNNNSDELNECCSIVLTKTGIPGYLSGSICLDIHKGDGWTPLMEAICVGNLLFANALVQSGADILKCDERGLNSLFWAKVLHGETFASALQRNATTTTTPTTSLNPSFQSTTTSSSSSLSSLSSSSMHTSDIMVASSLADDDHPDGYKAVSVKDGQRLWVSDEVYVWMESNFPVDAAKAFALSTLKLALTAQGFVHVYEDQDKEWLEIVSISRKKKEEEKELKEETLRLEKISNEEDESGGVKEDKDIGKGTQEWAQTDHMFHQFQQSLSVEEKALLNTNFNESFGVSSLSSTSMNPEGCLKSTFSDQFDLESRLLLNGDIPQFLTKDDDAIPNHIDYLTVAPCTSIIGFMQDVVDSRTKWPHGPEVMVNLLNNARLIAIGNIAKTKTCSMKTNKNIIKENEDVKKLSFFDSFILSILASDSQVYKSMNDYLNTNHNNNHNHNFWIPLIGSFVQTLEKMPKFIGKDSLENTIVYSKLPSMDVLQFIVLNDSSKQPSTILWNSFLSTTCTWSNLFSSSSASTSSKNHKNSNNNNFGGKSGGRNVETMNCVYLSIKSKSGRMISMYTNSPNNHEVIFMPFTRFQILSIFQYDQCLTSDFGPSSNRITISGTQLIQSLEQGNSYGKFFVELEEL